MKAIWLRDKRRELNLSQQDLADMLNNEGFAVTAGAISHWENGRNQIPFEDAEFRRILANILGLSIQDMLDKHGWALIRPEAAKATRAAEIVSQLPDYKQDVALTVLEALLRSAP